MNESRILIIDDLYGRSIKGGTNKERQNLCAQFLLKDITGDETPDESDQVIYQPRANAFFYRGQSPVAASIGDTVENNLNGCLEIIASGWENPEQPVWSLILLDLCFYTGVITKKSNDKLEGMPEGRKNDDQHNHYFGLEVLGAIQKRFGNLPVIIFSSMKRQEVSLEFAKKGALGFLERKDPKAPEMLDEYLWRHGLIPDSSNEIIGNSKQLLFVLREARKLASLRSNILIRGERGTGKEQIAKYIHTQQLLENPKTPFVAVNSANFSNALYASELFGIEPKTATDVAGKSGLIEQANHGDIFFDEVGDMPSEVQAGLLRVLQERNIMRVGGKTLIDIDVRFISATNRFIELENYRTDLIDRLSQGGVLTMPPLRDRKEDIPKLVEKFVQEITQKNLKAIKRFTTPEALIKLMSYDWPGNVRELKNTIFDAVNSFPDVEYLVPTHIRLPQKVDGQKTEKIKPVSSLDRLIEDMFNYESDPAKLTEWAGKAAYLQSAYGSLIASLLKTSLTATKKYSPHNTVGQILIHPAVKLLTGDSTLSASQAADFIKRTMSIIGPDTTHDAVLNEALLKAKRLRPSSPKKTDK